MVAPATPLRSWNPFSGTLTIPFEIVSETIQPASLRAGPEGVGVGMTLRFFWTDLLTACQQLLGYSYRAGVSYNSAAPVGSQYNLGISRVLPWQHPLMQQTYVRSIVEARGISSTGNAVVVCGPGTSPGQGGMVNTGPVDTYQYVEITVSFWVPPYYVRTDASILGQAGAPGPGGYGKPVPEWLRYVDKRWRQSTQILTKEGSYFGWALGAGPPSLNRQSNAPLGLPVSHGLLSRTWYQVPETCLFAPIVDGTPQGDPLCLLNRQTETVNPITGYDSAPSASAQFPITNCVNSPVGGGFMTKVGTVMAGSTTVIVNTAGVNVNDAVTSFSATVLNFFPATYVTVVGGGQITISQPALTTGNINITFVTDSVLANQFFGAPMGTLRFITGDPDPEPLQLPPFLMSIGVFGQNQALSQVQYNVTLHFDKFDPERPSQSGPFGIANLVNLVQNVVGQPFRGHNLAPFSGNALWYPMASQQGIAGGATGAGIAPGGLMTPFQYADLSNIFMTI